MGVCGFVVLANSLPIFVYSTRQVKVCSCKSSIMLRSLGQGRQMRMQGRQENQMGNSQYSSSCIELMALGPTSWLSQGFEGSCCEGQS